MSVILAIALAASYAALYSLGLVIVTEVDDFFEELSSAAFSDDAFSASDGE